MLTTGSLQSTGAISVINGGTLTLGGNWSNTGTLTIASGSTANLGGTFTTVALGSLTNNSGGFANLTGVLDNTGKTLALSPTTGPLILAGGSIKNGSLTESGIGQLKITNSGGTLDGVAVTGNLDVSQVNNARLTVKNGLALTGTLSIGAVNGSTYGTVTFDSSIAAASISGPATVIFGGNPNNLLAHNDGSTGHTLTVASTVIIHGAAGTIDNLLGTGVIVNNGTITADVLGKTLTLLTTGKLQNTGPLGATNGGTLTLGGNWSNAGSLTIANGSTANLGGAFTTAASGSLSNISGGTLNLTGVLDNTGKALSLDSTTGPIQLSGGTINNGALTESGAGQLILTPSGGILNALTVTGNLDLSQTNNSRITIKNGVVLNGSLLLGATNGLTYGGVTFDTSTASATLSGTATVVFGGNLNNTLVTSDVNTANTLTFAPSVTIHGSSGSMNNLYNTGAIINKGVISADIAGGTLTLIGTGFGSFQNQATLQSLNGATLNVGASNKNSSQGALIESPTSTVQYGGNLLTTTTDPTLFSPQGLVTFNGVGTAANPQLVEATSQDVGAVYAGFTNNSAYGTFSLSNSTYVKLVDQTHNSSGSLPEAIYAQSVTVPAGTTLDLNGLNLYALTIQVNGSVVNGSITQVANSPILKSIETTPLNYLGAGPIAVTSTLAITDPGSPTLAGAIVQISSGYQNGADSLLFSNTPKISGAWDASTGTLTLAGNDTLANYQTAIRSVKFQNAGTNLVARTISFVATDGFHNSNSISRVIQIAGTVVLSGTTVTVTGTSCNDSVAISEGSSLVVTLNGTDFSFSPSSVNVIVVNANAGDDSVTLNSLNAGTKFSAYGGDGKDIMNVASSVTTPVTLDGGNGNDSLTGGSGNDVLNGGLGSNVLSGGDGNDTYNLTPRTVLGTDKDTIVDSNGSDGLYFNTFTNGLTLNLQTAGVQIVDLATGYQVDLQGVFEILKFGSGSDTVTGNATVGTSIDGGSGNNVITGGTGNDSLYAGAGNDTLSGLGGNDLLAGGTGTNILNGGAGDDSYAFSYRIVVGSDKDTVVDSSGNDFLSFSNFSNDLTFSLQTVGPQTADIKTGYQIDLQGTFESVALGTGNDNVTGNATVGTTINGGSGNNTLTGGAGNDALYGGTGNDVLAGLGGNDSLNGGTGVNLVDGGDGNDTFTLSPRTNLGTDKDTLVDSSGLDTLSFTNFTNDLTFNLQTLGPQTADVATGYQIDVQGIFESLALGSGNDTVTGNASVGTSIDGRGGNDILTGGSGNDSFTGGTGTNILNGGDGNDSYSFTPRTIVGSDKDTVIDSSGANDRLYFLNFTDGITLSLQTVGTQTVDPLTGYQMNLQGIFESVLLGSGNDNITGNSTVGTSINGGNGNNTLTGGSGNDVLVAGTGNDVLSGGAGNDSLTAGTGTNILNGGDGNDIYVPIPRTVSGSDKDTLIDSSGSDSLYFNSFTDGLTFSLQAPGNQIVDSLTGYQLNIQGIFESVSLGSGNDSVIGNATVGTFIDGGAGNNLLVGGSGNDYLTAGTGNDTLLGFGGNDTLAAGTGVNVINGGDGDDQYLVTARTVSGSDKDTFIDSNGSDSISFAQFTNGLNFSLQVSGSQTADVLSGYHTEFQGIFETIRLGSGNDSVIGNASVDTKIYGGEGNNTLTGGSGRDLLYGGSGNDTLYGLGANDLLSGGLGTNLLYPGTGSNVIQLTPRSVPGTDKDTLVLGSVNDILQMYTFTHDITLNLQTSGPQTVDAITGYRLDIQGSLVEVDLGSGNDHVVGKASAPLELDGGDGNDTLIGGSGSETLVGGNGNDILVGGAGTDSLSGGAGNDLLIGGIGFDKLDGGTGDDLLIGGKTSFDTDLSALNAIQAEWTSSSSYSSRVDHLRGMSGGKNGTTVLTDSTVPDDHSGDILTGGSGNDWFWSYSNDSTDRVAGERID